MQLKLFSITAVHFDYLHRRDHENKHRTLPVGSKWAACKVLHQTPAHVDNSHSALDRQQHWSAGQKEILTLNILQPLKSLCWVYPIYSQFDLLLLYTQSMMTLPLPASAHITAHSGPDQHSHLQLMLGQRTSAGTSGNKTQKHQIKVFSKRREHIIAIFDHIHTWNFSLQVPTLTSVPQITSLWPAFDSLATAPSAFGCKISITFGKSQV